MIKITFEDDRQYQNLNLDNDDIKPEDLFAEIQLETPTEWKEITTDEFYATERFPRKQRAFVVITELACAVHIRQEDGTFQMKYWVLDPKE